MGLGGIGECGGGGGSQIECCGTWEIETVRPFRWAHDTTSDVCAENKAAAVRTFTADATIVKSSS